MSQGQKNKFRQHIVGQYHSKPTQEYSRPHSYAPQQNQNSTSPQSLQQQQYDLWQRQQMFNMMNNMSLQNHATTMNIIENIGGTGNYWEVK